MSVQNCSLWQKITSEPGFCSSRSRHFRHRFVSCLLADRFISHSSFGYPLASPAPRSAVPYSQTAASLDGRVPHPSRFCLGGGFYLSDHNLVHLATLPSAPPVSPAPDARPPLPHGGRPSLWA